MRMESITSVITSIATASFSFVAKGTGVFLELRRAGVGTL
jgi:hypothetical protein